MDGSRPHTLSVMDKVKISVKGQDQRMKKRRRKLTVTRYIYYMKSGNGFSSTPTLLRSLSYYQNTRSSVLPISAIVHSRDETWNLNSKSKDIGVLFERVLHVTRGMKVWAGVTLNDVAQ